MKIFEDEFLYNKRINTLPFRAHYIPFDKKDKIKHRYGIIDKNSSSRLYSLNGIWNFKAFKKYQDVTNLDISFSGNDRIDVPASVQTRGYDYIQYLNCRYPFPFHPPYIDIDNPLFFYSRSFIIEKKEGRIIIVFEGVDNAFYLFINKIKVGYSNIAHSKSEFDITDYVKIGENIIDVLVLKYSASSYFECQDKFRMSGIFRDVYLLYRDEKHITDYRFITHIKKDKGIINFINNSEVDISLKFKNKSFIVSPHKDIDIIVNHPRLWNEEDPYLYNFSLSHGDEIIYERVGIREISTSDGVFKINGKHIKLKGVNRHESHPVNGATVSIKDTYNDLKMMKGLGVNAIRTSHYPNIPQFYQLCDVMGLYVLDEADLETHGADYYTGRSNHQLWKAFADDMANEEAIYLREVSLFEADKNFTCVIIFSLGNESSFGKAFYKGLDYLKTYSDRPIHYEGVYNADKIDYYDSRIDFASRMYASPYELVHKHLEDKKENRPIILCEYSHAMGNSNGDLLDYWKVINSSNRFAGGFIWEWCDHVVEVNGKPHYGGDDNPELINDGNFCVDGLVSPYRQLKSNTLEMEAIYKGKYQEDKKIDKTKSYKPRYNKHQFILVGDDINGGLSNLLIDGKPVFDKGISINYLRAKIDNDNEEILDDFNKIANSKIHVIKVDKSHQYIKYKIELINEEKLLSLDVVYQIINDHLQISLSYQIEVEGLFFPRIGLSFKLKKKAYKYKFFGYGPDESYIDKHIHNKMGEFNVDITSSYTSNIKPQECGSRYYSSYVEVNDLSITADKPFSFSILPFSQDELENTKHNYELINKHETYINLDIAMAGVGTHSCGPSLDKKYWIKNKDKNIFKIFFK